MEHYRIVNDVGLYYVTFTVTQWLPVLIDEAACKIVTESFNFCIQKKYLRVNAYVIMPTHLHAILFDVEFNTQRLKHALDDLRKFTGRQLLDHSAKHLPKAFTEEFHQQAGKDRERKGNGTDTIGIYRNGTFYLSNSNTSGIAEIVFAFGAAGDQPIAGDWDGDGIETIGVYHSATGAFLLRNSNSAGAADLGFSLGGSGDLAIAGDWNGDGVETTGVFRPSMGTFYLSNSNDQGFADISFGYGLSGDQPIAGDWNNDGIDTIGVFRSGMFYLRNANSTGNADLTFGFGTSGDLPIAGNWDALPPPPPPPTATPTSTPPSPSAMSASFTYDGDGKRVKSVINGTTTTYFVGTHYEVTNGVVTKYYYAGAQRIATLAPHCVS